jgi:branched-chain amino acid transport system substrate-binding protein
VTFSEEAAEEKGMTWIGPSQQEFIQLFKENTGEGMKPDYHAAEAGAQVLAYVLGVEKAGSTDSEQVREALGELEFMSFYGGWDVNENGMQVGHTMVNVQWQDGERALIWPRSAQTSKPVYPMPTYQEKDQGAVAVPK